MRFAGRLSAAIEVLEAIFTRHATAAGALSEWGRGHRFAGSGDRAAIGNLVYDALRQKASLAAIMGVETPRALVLAAAHHIWGISIDELIEASAEKHGPGMISSTEQTALATSLSNDHPAWMRGNYPEWLADSFVRAFGDNAVAQGQALSQRAPVDLRVNSLKTTREKLLQNLAKLNVSATSISPWGLRIAAVSGAGRNPNIEADPSHGRGHFEVQDEGSQIAALLSAAIPGAQVADICAGAGGKTLALAAMMGNKGQIHAWDNDKTRLRPIIERLKRAGAHNIQVIPADEPARLDALAGKLDLVLVDAPCSGTGAWRRKPDTKWRLSADSLATRMAEQITVLDRAAALVKPGGRVVYVTCSVLPQENDDQLAAFLTRHSGFQIQPYGEIWAQVTDTPPPVSVNGSTDTLLLTPANHNTDGFFIASLKRQ